VLSSKHDYRAHPKNLVEGSVKSSLRKKTMNNRIARRSIVARVIGLTLILFALASATAVPARAATITVNTLADESDGSCSDGDCSLRDAIAVASAGDTINFSVTGSIGLYGYLSISKNLTISGPGAASLRISGLDSSQVFYINSGYTVTIAGVTISNGNGLSGGGIYNRGTLNVTNCIFYYNNADFGGGISNSSDGTATVTNSTFSGNSANYDGGGIYNSGTLNVTSSTFSDNLATGSGGGIYNSAGVTATVTNSTFSTNIASSNGGGIGNVGTLNVVSSTFSENSTTDGGGIHNLGVTTVTSSTFSGNTATDDGGGIYNSASVTATVTNSTFSNNIASDNGGGIYNFGTTTVTNSTFSGNRASSGGGIFQLGVTTAINTIIANSAAGGNCWGSFAIASTNNLSTDATCSPGFTQVTSGQLALGSLTGTPAYFPLNAGSAAIDTGTNTGCPATDQRGETRPQDGDGNGTAICDAGSYEYKRTTNLLYLPLILR
jgi:CSLREA domain-containing protein